MAVVISLLHGGMVQGQDSATLISMQRYEQLSVAEDGSVTPTNARTMTIICRSNDRFFPILIRSDSDGDRYGIVECKSPTFGYVVTAKGYIPRDPFVYNARSCTADLASDIQSNGTVPLTVASGGSTPIGSRRLLYTGDNAINMGVPHVSLKPFRKFLQSDGLTDAEKEELIDHIIQHPRSPKGVTQWLPDSPHKRRNTRRLLLDSDKFCYGGGVGVGFVAVAVYCPGMQTADDVERVATLKADTKFKEAMKIWADNVTTIMTAQGQINTGLQEINQKQEELNRRQLTFQDTTINALGVLEQYVKNLAEYTDDQIQDVLEQMAAGFIEAGQFTDSRVAELQNATLNNFNKVSRAMTVMNQQDTNRDAVTTRRFVEVSNTLISTMMTLYYSSAGVNRNMDRADKGLIAAIVEQMESIGRTPMQDPAIPYVAPKPASLQTVDELKKFVNRLRINYQTTVQVGPVTLTMIHQYIITMQSNIVMLSEQVSDTISNEQLLTIVGPINCTQNATIDGVDPVYRCRAWWEISHKSCEMKSTFDGWQTITTNGDRAPYELTSQYCEENLQPQSDIYDGAVFDTITDFSDFMSVLSCESGAELAGDGNFQVVSERTGITVVEPSFDEFVCSFDFVSLFILGIGDPVNGDAKVTLPYAIFNLFTLAWPLLRTERTRSESLTWGIRPRGITSIERPFVTTNGNGLTARCTDTSIVGMGPDTDIIYTLKRLPIEREVVTTIYDREPDCTTILGVCTPAPGSNIISTTSVATSVIVNYDDSGEPFQTGDVLVGELNPLSAGGMSYVTDLPERAKSVEPEPASRENTASYILWPLPPSYVLADEPLNPPLGNLPDFEAAYPGVVFDHTKTISAGYHEAPVDVSTGKCIPVPGIEFQKACNVLDNWVIGSNTNMREGGLVLSPENWWMQVTLNVDFDGEIGVFVSEGCPAVTFAGGEGTGNYIELNNPSARQLHVVIDRVFQDGDDNITCAVLGNFAAQGGGIAPYQKVQVNIPPNCGNITVQVSQINIATGKVIPCGAPVTTYVSESTQSNVIGTGLTNFTTVLVANNVAQSLAATTLTQIEFQIQMLYSATKLVNPDITYDEIRASVLANSTLADFITQLQLQAQGVQFTDPGFEEQWPIIMNVLNSNLAAFNVTLNQMSAINAENSVIITQQNARIAELEAGTAQLKVTLDESIAANKREMDSIRSDSCDFICSITNVAVGILIFVAVALFTLYIIKYAISQAGQQAVTHGHPGIYDWNVHSRNGYSPVETTQLTHMDPSPHSRSRQHPYAR